MKATGKQWSKVNQLARHVGEKGQLGRDIIEFLRSKRIRERLIQAAEEGIPPVSAISEQLLEKFGYSSLAPHSVRRFLGAAVRAVLEDLNFEPTNQTARFTSNSLFSTGTIYRYVPPTVVSEADDMLFRMFNGLTVAELERAQVHIEKSLARQRRKK